MNLLPQAWEGGRKIETYTFNDRQVQRLVGIAMIVGILCGIALAVVFHIPALI